MFDKGDVDSVDPPFLIISLQLKDDLGNNYLCFDGAVGTRTEGARLGATGWDDVFLKPSSSVSGLVVSWARWISSFLLHWKHKAVASAPSEFGSGCFKPFKTRANICYYFYPNGNNKLFSFLCTHKNQYHSFGRGLRLYLLSCRLSLRHGLHAAPSEVDFVRFSPRSRRMICIQVL